MARHLITSALPYINGIKHLGNLVGSMLPSDAHARYLRLRGHEVLHICATDEHGTPAELAAAEAGLPVAEYCASMYRRQKELGDRFQIGFDWFGRSSRPQNHRLTQHFAGRLAANGLIHEVATTQLYSPTDGRFLPDRFVEGTCPNCEYPRARGDQCENCTKQLDPTDLVAPRSAISGATDLERRETRHLFLKQSQMREKLRAWLDSKTGWPKLASSIARSMRATSERCPGTWRRERYASSSTATTLGTGRIARDFVAYCNQVQPQCRTWRQDAHRGSMAGTMERTAVAT